MGERVGVRARLGVRQRVGARRGLDHRRLGQPGRRGGHLRELRGEFAEREVLGPLAHQPERGDLPERGGPAVAQDDLVAAGQCEKIG